MFKYLLKNIRSLEIMSVQKRHMSPKKSPLGSATKKLRLTDPKDNKSQLQDEKDELKQVQENYDFLFDEESEFDLDALDAAVSDAKVKKLDVSQWKRCVVEEVERDKKTFDLVLKLSAEDSPPEHNKENKDSILTQLRTTCRLQGPWCHTRVETGDILSLVGTWDEQLQAFKVNKDDGFCVTNPDTLISGTTVVGSLFCRRKAVLQDRFRGVDAGNKVMVIGSLVHELFQTVLTKGLTTYKAIEAAAKELLESQETAFTLYSSCMTQEETAIEMQKFVPNILSFMQQYIEGQDPPVLQKDLFQGTIAEIKDIEENLWVPEFGLKGKVDVSVRIQRRKNSLKFENMNKNAIPLELKTGRATFSMEHKGQVILYQMMLTAAGKDTNSGLLLYLREGIMREIQGARNEQRDLVVLRNDLSHYLSRLPPLPPAQAPLATGDGKFLQPFELPEPISHRACANCAYATLCCSFAKTSRDLELCSGHPLVKVMEDTTSHLKAEDYEYFIRWCGLLTLEEQEAKKSNYLRSLWTDSPDVRVRNGRAIVNLDLLDKVEFKEARYLHSFKQKTSPENADDSIDFTLCGFSIGEYVIVSSSNRLAIAAGCIFDLTKSVISISLERNLLKNYSGQSFIVDKHESQSGNVFNFTNLGLLLDNTERSNALRSIIVHREQPTYSKVLPKVVMNEGRDILTKLNSIQRAAVAKALSTESFMLIKGLPGTGKTQTLVAIVRLLNLMGKSVLITSHTHSAVDNLMLRLKPHSLKMLRLGSGARVNPQLREFAESELTANCKTEDELAAVYAAHNIVGVTCLGSAHSIFLHRKFDVCIVDEATQVMQCTVLRPLFFCEKFILVGDPDQLPPLIRSKDARQRGADESLFQRLDSVQATSVLTLQYRMNKTITKLANHLTYSGNLKCASKDVETAALKLEASPAPAEKWLQRAVHPHIDQAVFFLDTLDCADRSYDFASSKHSSTCAALEQTFSEDPTESPINSSSPSKQKLKKRLSKYTNYCEAAVVFQIVKHLLSTGYDPNRIGIIAPYRAQVELLRKLAEQHAEFYQSQTPTLDFANVEVNTVDQYQGRDKDVIIYSCAKTGAASARDTERSREAEILEDKRRLTVAITRSKHKLIMVGDAACLQQYTPFQELMARIPNMCQLKLEEGKLGFSWESMFGELSQIINS